MSPASPPAPPGYTAQQGQYLAFIHAYRRLHAKAPAEADIQRFFRVSPPSVHQMILKLEQAGLITRQPGVARSITLAIDPKALPELDPRHDQPVKITVPRYRRLGAMEQSTEDVRHGLQRHLSRRGLRRRHGARHGVHRHGAGHRP